MPQPVHESTLPAVLTLRDLASLLGVSTRQVYRAMQRRDWPFTPLPAIGARSLRWSRDQVLSMLSDARTRARRT
jgi:predicted DNA-binding transcriptional regulator AlpA